MKVLKTILCAGLALAPLAAGAQDYVGDMVSRVASSRVIFEYTYQADRMNGSGNLILQDSCYYLEGDGLKTWCDGSSITTYDPSYNEVVIESIGASPETVSPVAIVRDADKLFTWTEDSQKTTFAGKQARAFRLLPVSDDIGFEAVLYFTGDGSSLIGAELIAESVTMTFTISGFSYEPLGPLTDFYAPAFDTSVIVTDLR